jgi:hypothetical protein
MVLPNTVVIAIECTNNPKYSYATKCKLKYNGIRFINKYSCKNGIYIMLQLYNEIAELKEQFIGFGHHQTIDVYRNIVKIEKRIEAIKINSKKNKRRKE